MSPIKLCVRCGGKFKEDLIPRDQKLRMCGKCHFLWEPSEQGIVRYGEMDSQISGHWIMVPDGTLPVFEWYGS